MSYLRELVRIVSGPPKPTESYNNKKHAGYLIKEGSNFKTWKQRYFILNDKGFLFYFKSDNTKENPLNYFQVDNLEWVIAKNKKKGPGENAPVVPNCIKITRAPPLFIYSEDEEEMNKWKKALTEVGCRMALTEKEKKMPIIFVYDMRKEKETWKKIKALLLDAVGKKIAIDVDWNSFAQNEIIPKKDGKVVQCIYDYLLNLANAIDKSCKGGDIEREAFINGVYQSTIRVELDPAIAAETNSTVYYDLKLLDGALVLKSNDKNFWGNAHAVGKNLEDLYQFAGEQEVPLAIRKNIRDSNKYLAECLDIMKSISGGQNFSFEVDWKSLIYCDNIKRHQWDSMAEIVYKDYFLTLVKNIAKITEDEELKKAFLDAVSQKKVALSVKKVEAAYNATAIVGGVLHLYIATNGYHVNVATSGSDLQKAIQNTSGDELPCDARKNIKDEENKVQELIAQLKAATSFDYDIIVDWNTIVSSVQERDHSDVATEVYTNYLGSLVKRIVDMCADDMVREAFVSATPARIIRFTMAPVENADNAVKISQDGALILECKIDGGWKSNATSSGSTLQELLEFSRGDDILPLKVRKSIRDAAQHKEETLAAFKAISGREYEIEVDWEGLVLSESVDKTQWTKMGELVYRSYLLTLAKNIAALCKESPLVTESFTEHTHANRITFGMAPLQSGQYNSVTVVDGVLVVTCAQGGWFTNVSNIGKSDILGQLSDRDQDKSTLPLMLRMSISEHAPKFEKVLESWRAVAGDSAIIVVDWDSVASLVEKINWKAVGRSIQEDIATNIVTSFKNVSEESGKHLKSNKARIAYEKLGTTPVYLIKYNEESCSYELILNAAHSVENIRDLEVSVDLLAEASPQDAETDVQESSTTQDVKDNKPAVEEPVVDGDEAAIEDTIAEEEESVAAPTEENQEIVAPTEGENTTSTDDVVQAENSDETSVVAAPAEETQEIVIVEEQSEDNESHGSFVSAQEEQAEEDVEENTEVEQHIETTPAAEAVETTEVAEPEAEESTEVAEVVEESASEHGVDETTTPTEDAPTTDEQTDPSSVEETSPTEESSENVAPVDTTLVEEQATNEEPEETTEEIPAPIEVSPVEETTVTEEVDTSVSETAEPVVETTTNEEESSEPEETVAEVTADETTEEETIEETHVAETTVTEGVDTSVTEEAAEPAVETITTNAEEAEETPEETPEPIEHATEAVDEESTEETSAVVEERTVEEPQPVDNVEEAVEEETTSAEEAAVEQETLVEETTIPEEVDTSVSETAEPAVETTTNEEEPSEREETVAEVTADETTEEETPEETTASNDVVADHETPAEENTEESSPIVDENTGEEKSDPQEQSEEEVPVAESQE